MQKKLSKSHNIRLESRRSRFESSQAITKIFSKTKKRNWLIAWWPFWYVCILRALEWRKLVYFTVIWYFRGHLVYLVSLCHILWSLGMKIFYFGIVYQERTGSPANATIRHLSGNGGISPTRRLTQTSQWPSFLVASQMSKNKSGKRRPIRQKLYKHEWGRSAAAVYNGKPRFARSVPKRKHRFNYFQVVPPCTKRQSVVGLPDFLWSKNTKTKNRQ
jgi:hypothetical protein